MKSRKSVFVLIAVVSELISGCATNVDGSITLGQLESPAWFDTASEKTIERHFDSFQPHELCIKWAANPRHERIRREISASLMRRNMNPLLCY